MEVILRPKNSESALKRGHLYTFNQRLLRHYILSIKGYQDTIYIQSKLIKILHTFKQKLLNIT